MKRGLTLTICLVIGFFVGVVCLLLWVFVLPYVEARASVRLLDIPQRDDGFRAFNATAIHSEKEWQEFLQHLKTTKQEFLIRKDREEWISWLEFEEIIRQA